MPMLGISVLARTFAMISIIGDEINSYPALARRSSFESAPGLAPHVWLWTVPTDPLAPFTALVCQRYPVDPGV